MRCGIDGDFSISTGQSRREHLSEGKCTGAESLPVLIILRTCLHLWISLSLESKKILNSQYKREKTSVFCHHFKVFSMKYNSTC